MESQPWYPVSAMSEQGKATRPTLHPVDEIMRGLGMPTRRALLDAYEAGRIEGSRQARAEMTKMVQTVMSHAFGELLSGRVTVEELTAKTITPQESPKTTTVPHAAKPPTRAPKGAAKPAVLETLAHSKGGMTTQEVFDMIAILGPNDIKFNTVRGTLWRLWKAGDVFKDGDRWKVSDGPEKQKPPVAPGALEGVA